jgi:hypothetical protein
MDLHNKNTLAHFAWFDKHIATDKRGATNESQVKPLTPSDGDAYIIVKHKSENLIKGQITVNDVLFDRDIITWDEYLNGL